MKARLLTTLLLFAFNCAFSQSFKNDARTMITVDQINQILGCKVSDSRHEVSPLFCSYYSVNMDVKVSFDMTDKGNPVDAVGFIKNMYSHSTQNIAAGKKPMGKFTVVKNIDGSNQTAFYMAAPGSQTVLLMFAVGSTAFNFYTSGIDADKVIAKLPAIYKQVSNSYKK